MKRILTVAPYTIGDRRALGITMEKFFYHYNRSKIFQIYFDGIELSNIGEQSYQFDYIWYLYKHRERNITQNEGNGESIQNYSLSYKTKNVIKSFMPIILEQDLNYRIKEFNPEVLYVQLYGVKMIELAELLKKRLNIPMVIHMFDNWMGSDREQYLFPFLYDRNTNRKLRKLIRKANWVFGAAPTMCDFLDQSYGCNSDFVMPYAEFPDEVPIFKEYKETIKFLYTGNIELGRHMVIKEFISNMDESGLNYHLDIYTRQTYLFDGYHNRNVEIHKPVEHSEIQELLSQADALLHAESFEEKDICYTKYSVSTKIPEYMSAGKPVFYLGPLNIGVGVFLYTNDFAFCTESPSEVPDLIKRYFLLTQDEKMEIIKNRFTRAKELLSEEKMGEVFGRWYK